VTRDGEVQLSGFVDNQAQMDRAFEPGTTPTHSEPTSPTKTGGGYLRFINGQRHYIVYTAIGKGWGAKDGVAVEKNNQLIGNLMWSNRPGHSS